MPSSRQRITVIGTGCFGASIGLAIRRSKDAEHLEVVGHDREHGIARQAKKLGAFDDVHFNLDLALRGAQLVVLAVPLAALREVLQDVGRLLETQTRAWQMTAETVEQGGLFQRTLHAMFGEGLTKKPERSQGPF